MFPEECKNFINQYVSNDHTNRALYLHAPHGYGKTHFLKEDLSKQKDVSYQFVMVSLSGMTTLTELSKSIFLAAHQFKNTAKAKRAETVSHIIAKNVAAQFNIDLSLSEKELQTFYDVVDFYDRLLVIDDVEFATQIHGFWGYIKGLLFDDVKVLLVSSEEPPYQEEQVTSIIGDKLKFQYESNVPSLLAHDISKSTNCTAMTTYIKSNTDWTDLLSICNCGNLHILRFALSKICSFINECKTNDECLIRQIFKSMLILSPLYLQSTNITLPQEYEYAENTTQTHIESRYIIYRSCLRYLQSHVADKNKLQREHSIYLDCTHFDRRCCDSKSILHQFENWRYLESNELIQTMHMLESEISKNKISWCEYPYILINLQHIRVERPHIKMNTTSVVNQMKQNIRGQAEMLLHRHVSMDDITGTHNGVDPNIVQQLEEALQQPYDIPCNFTYKPEDFYDYFLSIPNCFQVRLYNKRYLAVYDIQRFAAMFQQPTAELCEQMKELMQWLYSEHNVISPEEVSFMQEFNTSLTNILEKSYHELFEVDILRSLQTEVNRWIQHFTQSKTPTSN